MGTEIKTWQIDNNNLSQISSKLSDNNRTEPYDLEPWIQSNSEILSHDIVIIGRQVQTRSGPIDLLALDSSGNLIIIELKREKLPREALAQAIDYASDVATWSIEKISEICSTYSERNLDEFFEEQFPDVDLDSIVINNAQRILLVGFSIESSLERMIAWLLDTYGVNINAIILSYIVTKSRDEILLRTSIISEEIEQERVKRKKKFEIPMSDEPGTYSVDELKLKLRNYLSKNSKTIKRIREVLIPACLEKKKVTREDFKTKYIEYDPKVEESKIGYYLTPVSSQLGMTKNDFLRQIIQYEYPRYKWEKDNFHINDDNKVIIKEVLKELENNK